MEQTIVERLPTDVQGIVYLVCCRKLAMGRDVISLTIVTKPKMQLAFWYGLLIVKTLIAEFLMRLPWDEIGWQLPFFI